MTYAEHLAAARAAHEEARRAIRCIRFDPHVYWATARGAWEDMRAEAFLTAREHLAAAREIVDSKQFV